MRRRAEQLYQQLDMLQYLRQQVRRELLAESRKHPITAKLRQIPSARAHSLGPDGGSHPDPASFPHQATAVGGSGLGSCGVANRDALSFPGRSEI